MASPHMACNKFYVHTYILVNKAVNGGVSTSQQSCQRWNIHQSTKLPNKGCKAKHVFYPSKGHITDFFFDASNLKWLFSNSCPLKVIYCCKICLSVYIDLIIDALSNAGYVHSAPLMTSFRKFHNFHQFTVSYRLVFFVKRFAVCFSYGRYKNVHFIISILLLLLFCSKDIYI